MNVLLESIVTEANRHVTQKCRNIETTKKKIMAILGINFIMVNNRLPAVGDCWPTDKNMEMERSKTYKVFYKVLINKVFAEILGNSPFQSGDGHICKFKGRSSMG